GAGSTVRAGERGVSGPQLMCGIDEAGRGPLAGAGFAPAGILDPPVPIARLADPQQRSAHDRATLAADKKRGGGARATARASVEEIDTLNILRASLLAMRRAVGFLSVAPCEILVDGVHTPGLPIPTRTIVRGDQTVAAIAAASILAKVARDGEMLCLHRLHPHYGFDRHKGYS